MSEGWVCSGRFPWVFAAAAPSLEWGWRVVRDRLSLNRGKEQLPAFIGYICAFSTLSAVLL